MLLANPKGIGEHCLWPVHHLHVTCRCKMTLPTTAGSQLMGKCKP
jgi:hypothetical protein